ncbi:MAG: Rne/Rng family ribonuclease [Phycisphaerales bacterium]|jgi:ribonuclease E|nr:Rne/Rng family ribonuclease [Phycisphaerales bacterium]
MHTVQAVMETTMTMFNDQADADESQDSASSATPSSDAPTTASDSTTTKKVTKKKTARKAPTKKKAAAKSDSAKKTTRKTTRKTEDPTIEAGDSSPDATETSESAETAEAPPKKKTRRRSSRTTKAEATSETSEEPGTGDEEDSEKSEPTTKKRRRRSSKRTKSTDDTKAEAGDDEQPEAEGTDTDDDASEETAKKTPAAKKTRARREWRRPDRAAIEVTPTGPMAAPGSRTMLIDDVPGESCRIAILEKGRLEELFVERTQSATMVGNIYKARVVNVESAIQAAFVDYGEGMNGFLHVSDLHPRYFPGGDKTEKVGRKTPRRERPPIQDALKKGQEILVQVLKQGVGTKGPTVTSYLSIPGRLLVMMPGMDRVGVSRKVDDDQREKMRKILDQLDLPDGFGFIVRTAGYDKTKTELKRDAAFLKRLWTQLEKRMDRVGAPSELYTEGDLIVRTIRDVVDSSIDSIVINSREGFERARTFLSVVSPRSAPKVRFYDRPVPLFDAFGTERQIEMIHAREVPLKSGGALVIDQTEAMVAIDINSGRSRGARDAESNAVSTNREAADEIVRQLRLRDQGGLVVCDFIDMRFSRNRKEIEDRMAENLRQDRARTTFLPISEFGLIEMTRQRIRPSIRSQYFAPCNSCSGLGEIRNPDSVAADAVRRAARVLSIDKVHRVELVCGIRVASALLSGHRRRIDELERRSGGQVDIRISEQIGGDRFDIYAYDDRNADIDLSRLPVLKTPKLEELVEELPDLDEPIDSDTKEDGDGRRRRRRRRKPVPADVVSIAMAGGFDIDDEDEDEDDDASMNDAKSTSSSDAGESGRDREEDGEGGGKRRRRRRRRRGRGPRSDADAPEDNPSEASEATPAIEPEPTLPVRVHVMAKDLGITSKEILTAVAEKLSDVELKNHMSSIPGEFVAAVRRFFVPEETPAVEEKPDTPDPAAGQGSEEPELDENGEPKRKRRRRRRGGRRRRRSGDGEMTDEDGRSDAGEDAAGQTASTDGSAEASIDEPSEAPDQASSEEPETSVATQEEPPAVSVVETAKVEIKTKPRKRSLYGGRHQRRGPGQSAPDDR